MGGRSWRTGTTPSRPPSSGTRGAGCGEFLRLGMVKAIHESSGAGVPGAVRSVIRACNWKGAVGCSVTRVVWRTLGATQAEKTLSGVAPTLTDKVVIHTDAAAYAEMLWDFAQS